MEVASTVPKEKEFATDTLYVGGFLTEGLTQRERERRSGLQRERKGATLSDSR